MTGLLSDDGYIYQRKLIIYHIIEALLNSNLAECRIELALIAESETEDSYSLDFRIKSNGNKYKYYEVKNRISMYEVDKLRPIINKFYKLYQTMQNEDCQFILIHASQIKKHYLEGLHSANEIEKHNAINRILGVVVDIDFARKIYLKQVLDETDKNLDQSTTDLLCIGLIKKLLKIYNISHYENAEKVYFALKACFENQISLASANIKKRIDSTTQPFPIKDSVVISLGKLIDFTQSIIDEIMNKPKAKFTYRRDAINDFYTRFGIPKLEEPYNLQNENN